jgi:hypothetical protein
MSTDDFLLESVLSWAASQRLKVLMHQSPFDTQSLIIKHRTASSSEDKAIQITSFVESERLFR